MYGLKPLFSAALFTSAAAQICRKRLSPVRSIPICRRSLSSAAENYQRKRLPAELSEGITAELTCDSSAPGGVCDVYVIGTTHDNQESREKVKAVIQFVKPQVVFLELCSIRRVIYNKDKESEFYVANEEARKSGAKIVLGDRPIDITLGRFSIIALVKDVFIFYYFKQPRDELLLRSLIKKLRGKMDADTINLINRETARMLPTGYKTYIHERDQYMAAKLLEVASKHNSVVAIVGSFHVPGIQDHWKQPVDVQQIIHVSIGKRGVIYIVGIGAPAAIIYAIIYSIVYVIYKFMPFIS